MSMQSGVHETGSYAARALRPRAMDERASMESAFRRAAVINAVLLKLNTIDLAELAVEPFHATFDAAIRALEGAATADDVRGAERDLAEGAYQRLRAFEEVLRSREAEFTRTISLLTDAVVQFRDSNTEFTSEVLGRSDRLEQLTTIDDLRTLRLRLEQEVAGLREAVALKQEADAQQLAALSARVESLEARLAAAVANVNSDALTGLPNRAAWDQRMGELTFRLASGDTKVALAMIDLDRFKQINDTHGHSTGDAALADLARLCNQAFGNDDFVARFGGDEFAVLLEAPTPEHAAEHLHRLIQSVHRANEEGLRKERVPFTVSIGLAIARDNERVQALLNRADKAMYAAKESGRDRIIVAAA